MPAATLAPDAPLAPTMIRIEGLRKAYADQEVLLGVDLDVDDGEVFGFVGPNGAGKSTLLKCVLGVARPDAGAIQLGPDGDVVDARRDPLAARRRVGYAPGETSIYQRLRATEFLDFALAHYPDPDPERGRALLERFGLPPRKRIKGFSHGMKRKLLLAQALASGTPVLMLDEPMEGLDPDARRTIEHMLLEEAAAGRTVFFSSHDLASVERICRRVAFLRQGRILETGRIDEIMARAGRTLLLTLREARERAQLPHADDWQWSGAGTDWRVEFDCELEEALAALHALPLAGIRDGSGRLEDVFDSLYGPIDEQEEA